MAAGHRGTAAILRAVGALLLACLASAAQADPSDIDAAARGVVRVVIVQRNGDEVVPVSHGTGFAVGPERIVTNAHVVQQARADQRLAIAIVPSDGATAVYARLVAVNERTDLALLATTEPMRLAPLTIAGNPPNDGAVTAVGYPMNVDRAQGLSIDDIFHAQPPVKSTGFLSGRRPTREFDSLLHTAPIARGNSGGPLLDDCGRVIGVNSFGAQSGDSDAEFYFAVSNRELLPFLRANDVMPQVNGLVCRSLAELDAADRERAEQERAAAATRAAAEERTTARRREQLEGQAVFAIMAERENALALALVLLIAALGAGGFAYLAHERGDRRTVRIAGGTAAAAVAIALLAWFLRPGYGQVTERVDEAMLAEKSASRSDDPAEARPAEGGELTCVLDPDRSRVTGAETTDIPLTWKADGCVNGRTQYGFSDEVWTRVFVPGTEAAVSVNRYDPRSGEYRMERYLLDHEAMERARAARAAFTVPQCGAGDAAARALGDNQQAVLALLPARPNERLVYKCSAKPVG